MEAAPTHCLIVVLDLVRSGQRANPLPPGLRRHMYRVTERALEASVMEPLTMEDRGDGILLVLPGDIPEPRLVGLFVSALDSDLRTYAREHRGTVSELRMRVALHAGEARRDARGWSGPDLDAAFRMTELPYLRRMLTSAPRAVLALAVSDVLHQAVVRHDCPGIEAAEYRPVRFSARDVRDERVWLRVPGYFEPPGIGTPAPVLAAPISPRTSPRTPPWTSPRTPLWTSAPVRGAEGAQPEAVEHDRDGGEGHRRAGDHRIEEPGGGQRDRGGVVAERPDQVGLDGEQRLP